VGQASRSAGVPLRLAYADPPYPGLSARYYSDHPDFGGEVDHGELIRRLSTYDGWALSTSAEALPVVLGLCPAGVRVAAWHRGERPTRSARPLNAWEPVIYFGGRAVVPRAVDASNGDRPATRRACSEETRGAIANASSAAESYGLSRSAAVVSDASAGSDNDASPPGPYDASRPGQPDASQEYSHDASRSAAARRLDSLVFHSRPRRTDPLRVIGSKPAVFCRWMFDLLGAQAGDQLEDLFPGSGGVTRAWESFLATDQQALA